MAINTRGNYQYTESDTAATASDMLNKQTAALNAKPNCASGRETGIDLTASVVKTVPISFPSNLVTSVPRVVVSTENPPAWSPQPVARATNVTATGCTVEMYSTSGRSGCAFSWVAVG